MWQYLERYSNYLNKDLDIEGTRNNMNPKDKTGQSKTPMALIPSAALVLVAEAMRDGAIKYGPYNWRNEAVQAMAYSHAIDRHHAAYKDGENEASDSKIHHMAHIAATALIVLDAMLQDKLIDDRPPKGKSSDMLAKYTRKK